MQTPGYIAKTDVYVSYHPYNNNPDSFYSNGIWNNFTAFIAGYAEQIAAGEEPHAVTPRGQINETIEEKRGLGAHLERGREWLHEMVRDQAELAAHGMASLVQGAARTMRAGLQTSTGDGFDVLPALDQSPRQQQTPALDHGQNERDRQRQRQRGHDRDGPESGSGGRSNRGESP